jgi:hypothetical protein
MGSGAGAHRCASKTALLMTAAGGVGGGLATTSRLVFGVVVDEHHLYVVGDLGEVQDGVGGPLQAGDAAVVEGDFLVQLSDWMMLPSIWLCRPSGLMTRLQPNLGRCSSIASRRT